MTATGCPTCGSKPSPVDGVVRGLVDRGTAPRLTAAWTVIRHSITRHPGIAMGDLRLGLDGLDLAAPRTTENLIRAAAKAGLIRREYATGGTPRRQRCHLFPTARLTGEQP